MEDTGGGGRLSEDQKRAADDADTLPGLGRPAPVGAGGVEPPVGVIGIGGDHGDLVALAQHLLRQLGRALQGQRTGRHRGADAVLFQQAQIQAPDAVWGRITWAWIVFFAFMTALNGYVATQYSLDAWVNFKVWWAMGIFFAFTVANVVVLAKYMKEGDPVDNAPTRGDQA